MKIRTIAIVGLGQIGGSLALALRKAKPSLHISGVERNRRRLQRIKDHLDAVFTQWKELPQTDLVILCLHSNVLMRYFAEAKPASLILDVCSTKAAILVLANRKRLRLIGGHPMAGNERAGEAGWDATLFHDAPFFLCPAKRVTAAELREVKQLLSLTGALPIRVDPIKHDRFIAMTSHFPAFLSLLLLEMTSSAPAEFRGPGYRSMTRLAKTSPGLLQTFLHTNRKNILDFAKNFQRKLNRWIEQNNQSDP